MIERRRTASERRRLVDEFVTGLGRGEVVAHLQPIVETASRRLVGLEALARWDHPRLGQLSPAAFLDLVEDAGLGADLGDAVLASACVALRALAARGHEPHLSINLSVGQLTDAGITARIGRIIARHHLSPQRLEIEITEQAILPPLPTATGVSCDHTLHALHAAGATLMLDDFGTGYSSMTHVRRFPLGAVKIDRSFVNGMLASHEDRAVVESIIGLARALDLRSVAEGVESLDELAALHALGCDRVQGHLIAPAMSGAAILGWIERSAIASPLG
jgi:EAL domain-containing protein (putative c-di-GMP-specific phosphodiesterase class I)